MIIFGRWTYTGYIIFPSESCIAHALKNQIIWNKYFTNQFQVLEAGRKSALMVFRLCLIAMFKEALWVGASAHFFFLIEYPDMWYQWIASTVSNVQYEKEDVEWEEHQSLNNSGVII